MVFRRRRDAEPEPEATVAEAVAGDEDETEAEEEARQRIGPWDAEADPVPEMERVDFGAIQVPIGEGIEIQVNVETVGEDEEGNPVGGRIIGITIVHGESGLQVQPFAAPKRTGIWEEVRRETADEIKQAQGETQEAEGPFGTELHGMVPVAITEEMRDQVPPEVAEQGFGWQPVRFIGVDGPRWFLRGVLQGAALQDAEQSRKMEEIFQQIVVVRGDAAKPPRELLDLALPAEAQQAIADQDGEDQARPSLNPFERGPEITEVR